MRAVNEYDIPLRCISCPRIAPTTEILTRLENEDFVLSRFVDAAELAMSSPEINARLEEIADATAELLKRLGELAAMAELCEGVAITQVVDDESITVSVMHCGLG